CPEGALRGAAGIEVRRSPFDRFRTAGFRSQLVGGVKTVGTVEAGFHVSGPSAGEGPQRPDGRHGGQSFVHSTQAGRVTMRALAAAVALLVVGPSLAFAQFRAVRAELTPIIESEAHPGGNARAA